MIFLVISKLGGAEEVAAEKEFTVALEAKEFIRTSPAGSEFQVTFKQDEAAVPEVTEFVSADVATTFIDSKVQPVPEEPPTP